jgi:arsenate reductase (thioredoxin)
MKRVAFICVENSNRSQMAQAFAMKYEGIEAHSAGSKPSGRVNPRAIEMMQEKAISLAHHRSKSLDDLEGSFDAVVTMGCGDACPWIPAKQRIEWALRDPKDVSDEEFRAIRDDIEKRVASLVLQLRAQ